MGDGAPVMLVVYVLVEKKFGTRERAPLAVFSVVVAKKFGTPERASLPEDFVVLGEPVASAARQAAIFQAADGPVTILSASTPVWPARTTVVLGEP